MIARTILDHEELWSRNTWRESVHGRADGTEGRARASDRVACVAAHGLRYVISRGIQIALPLVLLGGRPTEILQVTVGAVDADAEIRQQLSFEAADDLIRRRRLEVVRPAILLIWSIRVARIDAHGISHACAEVNLISLCDLVAILIGEVHVDVVGVAGSRQGNVTASELAGIPVIRSSQECLFLLAERVG